MPGGPNIIWLNQMLKPKAPTIATVKMGAKKTVRKIKVLRSCFFCCWGVASTTGFLLFITYSQG